MPGWFLQAVNKCVFYVDTTRLFFSTPIPGPCAISTWRMCLIKSGGVMMRWCVRDDKRVWRGGGRRWAHGVPPHRLHRISTPEDVRTIIIIGNFGIQKGSWSRKISKKFRVAIQLNIQRTSPPDLPFGCVSFIAAENEIKAFSFVYLFVNHFCAAALWR